MDGGGDDEANTELTREVILEIGGKGGENALLEELKEPHEEIPKSAKMGQQSLMISVDEEMK